jgi:hypothetical protein
MTGINGRRRNKVRTSSVLLAALLVWHAPAINAEEYKIYYLGGQSNMDGYGYVEKLPENLKAVIDGVMIYTGVTAFDDDRSGGLGIWEQLEPGHGTGFKSDGKSNELSDRFGPELTFGTTIRELSATSKIAIIKYSLGGSGLAPGIGYGSWYPDYVENGGVNQYDHALRTIREALSHQDIDGDGEPDQLIPTGIVWMQGETEAYDSEQIARGYQANLKRMMDLLRAALRVDDLPVVIGKITDSGMAEDGSVMDHIEIVQAAQAAYVEADECAAFVTATDEIGYDDDPWHYNTDGFVRMGEAFAEAMLELEATCGPEL